MGISGIPEMDISGIIPEVRLKTDLISSTRDLSYLIFGDSSSKSVDTGAVN